MTKFFYIFVIVFASSCASNIVPKFPISSYINDDNAVKLKFACVEKIGLTDSCNPGLYIDYEQVYEAFGDFTISRGGMQKETIYEIRIPEGKYLFSPYGKGRMGNGAYDKFVNVSGNTCVILNEVKFELNIFSRVTDNEGSWVRIECSKFDEITQGFEKIVLNEPVSFTDKIL